MSASHSKTLEFQSDIENLIAQIEACIPQSQAATDREHQLQQQAYQERRGQAQRLFETLASHGEQRWNQMDGDAYRVRESLKLSLDFFRRLL